MKKIIAILPAGYDWSRVVHDGLAFGLSAAVAVSLAPAFFRAAALLTARLRGPSGQSDGISLLPLKVFGQRR